MSRAESSSEADPETAALLRAIADGESATVEALLESAPGLARARDPQGVSAVLVAAYRGQHGLAETIRARLAELDVFEAAALGDLPELRRHLEGDPAAVDDRSADGFTPLHLAAFFGHTVIANVLLAAGADPNAEAANASRVRPLHSAAASRSAGVLRAVLAGGADPDAKQHGGYTALLAAAKHGDRSMVAALLGHGADPELTADDGTSPLAFAREADVPSVIALLEAALGGEAAR